jgi:NADPH:quinone reductase
MKKVVQHELGSAQVLQVVEVDSPVPQNEEVKIKGFYTSINFADIKKRTGAKDAPAFPFTLGLDIVGEVMESNSRHFEIGDHVIAFPKGGSYAQEVTAHESLVYKIPRTLDLKQAAAMPTVSFLANMLVQKIGQVQPTNTVIVHSAAGGVGSMLIQLCKTIGCETIIATVGSDAKFDYVKSLGATHVCTYDTFTEFTNELTNNVGANVIFDSVAGDVSANSLKCLAPFGTLVQFGNSSGQKATFTNTDVHNSCRAIKGFSLGTTRQLKPEIIRPFAEQMIEAFANGTYSLNISAIYPLEDVVQAHEAFEKRIHNGKILLALGGVD